jgi:dienelactone hydrolase
VSAARKLPGANGRVGTMAYCLGGRLAFMMAERSDADVNFSYYGGGLDNLLGDLGNVRKPLVVHIAAKDEFFPTEGRAKVVEAAKDHKQIASYTYSRRRPCLRPRRRQSLGWSFDHHRQRAQHGGAGRRARLILRRQMFDEIQSFRRLFGSAPT